MNEREEIASRAYSLGSVDTLLIAYDRGEFKEPLAGILRESLEGWQTYLANRLEQLGITIEARVGQ